MLSVRLLALNAGGSSGVPRYTATLTRAVAGVAGEFPELDLSVVTDAAGAERIGPVALPVRRLPASAGKDKLHLRLLVEHAAPSLLRGDLVHFFDVGMPVRMRRTPYTVTFHDASISYPGWGFSRAQLAYKGRLYPRSLAHAARVLAVSQFAKDEAVARFGVDPARIEVVRSGPGFAPSGSAPPPPRDERPYVLFAGSLTRNKNVPFLVRAFARADVAADLVLAGAALDDATAVEEAIAASPAPERVRIVPRPSDDELDALYRGAVAFAFPSRYEGFGFPPLEAMGRGCPVLASDIPPLRELLDGGAMLLPLEEEAWAAALRRVVGDDALRAELRAGSAATVARYSWADTARGLCRVLSEAGSR
jgi:glycosyltransferase involved in cell wall biosynthesis